MMEVINILFLVIILLSYKKILFCNTSFEDKQKGVTYEEYELVERWNERHRIADNLLLSLL